MPLLSMRAGVGEGKGGEKSRQFVFAALRGGERKGSEPISYFGGKEKGGKVKRGH